MRYYPAFDTGRVRGLCVALFSAVVTLRAPRLSDKTFKKNGQARIVR